MPSTGTPPPYWATDVKTLAASLGSSTTGGLSSSTAEERRIPRTRRTGGLPRSVRLFLDQFRSPIILILAGATIVSMALGDTIDGTIILIILVASGTLGFWQERAANDAVAALLATVTTTTHVVRDGSHLEVPIEEVVPGDLVHLAAGDVIPADARLVAATNLLVDESALTGESFPVEKQPAELAADVAPSGRINVVLYGTHVVSGTGSALAVTTGKDTEFGAVRAKLGEPDVVTGFEEGITRFGVLLVRVMIVMVTAVFVANLLLSRPLLDSFLFSLALAVGITPQLLPAIVSVSLARGARVMAARKVIVKRLDAIEDFGAMTLLMTDKTGTLTAGAVRLDEATDLDGKASAAVGNLAVLNAGLQQGFSNPLDAAILAGRDKPDRRLRRGEVPYDFQRKRVSVLVDDPGGPLLVTKGAVESILAISTRAKIDGAEVPIDNVAAQVRQRVDDLGAQGFRVLGLATRRLENAEDCTVEDETAMTLLGLLVFHDPPKAGATESIGDLLQRGVAVKVVTGDSRQSAAKIAADVGLPTHRVVTGAEIDHLDDAALAEVVGQCSVFAEVVPLHKERLVRTARTAGEVVGFLGDGINDAPALHAADVGISVDTAVDVAKQAASIVLLDKSLPVVLDGVELGRQTFTNTLKYIRVTTSANFGNVFSMAAAAVFLPFLPLLPRQILLLNFLSDIPGLAIASDAVDPEQLERPRAWSLDSIRRFMIVYGLISTVFDLATFALLRAGFGAGEDLFRSGWFVVSTITELAAMLVLRTNRFFVRSRPGRLLVILSAIVLAGTVALPFSPLAGVLGLIGLPGRMLVALLTVAATYVAANEIAKRWVKPMD